MDLARTHASLSAEILQDFAELMDSGAFVNGPAVARFEEAFAAETGVARCVGMSSGLDALRIALIAGGPRARRRGDRPGDDVRRDARGRDAGRRRPGRRRHPGGRLQPRPGRRGCGGRPDRTRFVLPVHLYGQLADMRRLGSLGLPLIEDACQAPGAVRDGLRAGTGGLAAAFSFYPAKNLGAMGDAGALVTDERRARRPRRARCASTGSGGSTSTRRRDSPRGSTRFRRSSCSASCRCSSAGTTSGGRSRRLYLEALEGVGDLRLPPVPAGSEPVWHLFVVRTADPDVLAAHLAERGVQTGPPLSAPGSPHRGVRVPRYWPRARSPSPKPSRRECLSLPIFPGMREDERRARGRGGQGVLRPWLTHRPTTPRSARSST